jgi:hypothetical protein
VVLNDVVKDFFSINAEHEPADADADADDERSER